MSSSAVLLLLLLQTLVHAMKLPETFKMIGNVGLEEYLACVRDNDQPRGSIVAVTPIVCRTCARVGVSAPVIDRGPRPVLV